MVGVATGGLARPPSSEWSHVVFGCDPTPGIVSVDADESGRARLWRRISGRIEVSEQRFPNWFLTTSLDLLAHRSLDFVAVEALRDAHGELEALTPRPHGLSVVVLDDAHVDTDAAYRYLVLTSNLAEVSTELVEMSNKQDGGDAQTLADLRGLVLGWSPVEQFLTLSGRTYFKDMTFADIRRMQFDLETTGLDEDRDRIFMISMRDSAGWHECLDTGTWSEARLIERFVEIIQARDPDVLENHNIFAFDLPFLVKRAGRLGVRLRLGRDASEPKAELDTFDFGERAEPFVRWRIAGREVVDTQHAVRRFGLGAPDLRRHGLKEVARYFGFARPDREYVAGIDVWPTYRTDPARVRRYAADDVAEVDELSRRLLRVPFGLASRLPTPYEDIAADCGATSLWELLLVRAYLHAGRAIAAPMLREQPPSGRPPADLRVAGVVGASARATLRPLLPSIVANHGIRAANDDLEVLPRVVAGLVSPSADEAQAALGDAAFTYLSGDGLFGDPDAAAQAMRLATDCVDRLVADLEARGCVVIEIDGEQVSFGVPPDWTAVVENDLVSRAATYVPAGVRLSFPAHFQALYARAPRSAIVLGTDNSVVLVGSAFRPGRIERFGEAFVQSAAPHALRGEATALRQVFLDTIRRLRTADFVLADLCAQVTLHKSVAQYRRAGMREEPYEVLLSAGVRSWRVGQRIRYFRARGGEARLHTEGDGLTAADADPEFYVQRLYSSYCALFAQAFGRADFARIFRVPAGAGPYSVKDSEDLSTVRTIRELAKAT